MLKRMVVITVMVTLCLVTTFASVNAKAIEQLSEFSTNGNTNQGGEKNNNVIVYPTDNSAGWILLGCVLGGGGVAGVYGRKGSTKERKSKES